MRGRRRNSEERRTGRRLREEGREKEALRGREAGVMLEDGGGKQSCEWEGGARGCQARRRRSKEEADRGGGVGRRLSGEES